MTILESYLDYLSEETRWKKEVSKGLSDKSIEKIKDSKIAKTEKNYVKGLKKGTKQIMKKNNASVILTKAAGIHGPLTVPQPTELGSTVVQHLGNSKLYRLMLRLKKLNLSPREWAKVRPLIDRHEADEVVAAAKQFQDKHTKAGISPSNISFTHKGKLVGSHMSPDVLTKEKKIMDFQRKVYPSSGLDKLNKFRNSTGEYGVASKSKKELAKIKQKILVLRKERQVMMDNLEKLIDSPAKKGFINKIKSMAITIKSLVKTSKLIQKGVKLAI